MCQAVSFVYPFVLACQNDLRPKAGLKTETTVFGAEVAWRSYPKGRSLWDEVHMSLFWLLCCTRLKWHIMSFVLLVAECWRSLTTKWAVCGLNSSDTGSLGKIIYMIFLTPPGVKWAPAVQGSKPAKNKTNPGILSRAPKKLHIIYVISMKWFVSSRTETLMKEWNTSLIFKSS